MLCHFLSLLCWKTENAWDSLFKTCIMQNWLSIQANILAQGCFSMLLLLIFLIFHSPFVDVGFLHYIARCRKAKSVGVCSKDCTMETSWKMNFFKAFTTLNFLIVHSKCEQLFHQNVNILLEWIHNFKSCWTVQRL